MNGRPNVRWVVIGLATYDGRGFQPDLWEVWVF